LRWNGVAGWALMATAELLTAAPARVVAAPAEAALPRPADVLAATRRVADWQLAHRDDFSHMPAASAKARNPRDWQQATFWVALTELADRDPRYVAPLLALGRAEGWKLGDRPLHADDQLIAQAWLWAARHGAGVDAVAPAHAYFDRVLAHPGSGSLTFEAVPPGTGDPACTTRWCWCDALFMAPASLFRLARATGDDRYAAFADREYRATAAWLYDPAEHLFFRDSRFFDRRDDAGRKLFWSRGNGWVMAGLVRILATLDAHDPRRPYYVDLFRRMAKRIVGLQKRDGYWAPSLLAAENSPPETSGTAFFTYALAKGVDMKVLDRATYQPAALRGWAALQRAVAADGMLGWVQQVSDRPDTVNAGDTQYYAAGGFVLAGTAIYDLTRHK
jgi:unsaturated rhamnogalacturonyl hydrolase